MPWALNCSTTAFIQPRLVLEEKTVTTTLPNLGGEGVDKGSASCGGIVGAGTLDTA
jgi:hypothetical protein